MSTETIEVNVAMLVHAGLMHIPRLMVKEWLSMSVLLIPTTHGVLAFDDGFGWRCDHPL